jgi:hypothetical protein
MHNHICEGLWVRCRRNLYFFEHVGLILPLAHTLRISQTCWDFSPSRHEKRGRWSERTHDRRRATLLLQAAQGRKASHVSIVSLYTRVGKILRFVCHSPAGKKQKYKDTHAKLNGLKRSRKDKDNDFCVRTK